MEAIDDWAAGATIGGRAIPDLPDLRDGPWAIFAPLLTYRPQLNDVRDFREAQIAGAILNVA